ncbi:hypothetical protein HORIV_47660 [Vreelandella olivaria]|uniref:Uncharacterized protein n=1 Tax=Vreelandella olivaria TaxID=390919 RepID=A0ABM7GMX1_9GAMM|nr:hypothetical protein HORIV_47660 [Halomonas olivaria]
MPTRSGRFAISIKFLIALLTGVLLGSVVQTQFNLAALQSMGVEIPTMLRLETTLQDLTTFAPVYAALFIAGFLPSQIAAVLISRWLGGKLQALLSAGAAAIGLLVSLKIVDSVAPMPTFIAATREISGLIAMLLCAALAGWLFALLNGHSRNTHLSHPTDLPALHCGRVSVA